MADVSLVAAIENALARKQSMESAMQSLINAGYSKEQVQQAARQAQINMQQVELPLATSPQKSALSKAKRIILLIIFLSIIALGVIAYLIIKLI